MSDIFRIELTNLQSHWRPDVGLIRAAVRAAFKAAGFRLSHGRTPFKISIVLVDNKRIMGLNRRFLRRRRKTDVIAFPLQDRNDGVTGGVWGEVVVSVEKAIEEAGLRKSDLEKEVMLYVVHGILHLAGNDDRTAAGRSEMRGKEHQAIKDIFHCLFKDRC